MALNMLPIALFIILGQLHGHVFQTTKEEPQCLSRFDHDYKVLQKLVDLEQRIMTIDQRKAIMEQEKKIEDLEHRLSVNTLLSKCPDGWVYYNNSCYSFINELTMTWSTALEHCAGYGGDSHLVSIDTSMEQGFLQRYALKLAQPSGALFYWVGATDVVEEGTFVWQNSGKVVSNTDITWFPGQPNGKTVQNCACLWGKDKYTCHDWICGKTGYIICENSLVSYEN